MTRDSVKESNHSPARCAYCGYGVNVVRSERTGLYWCRDERMCMDRANFNAFARPQILPRGSTE